MNKEKFAIVALFAACTLVLGSWACSDDDEDEDLDQGVKDMAQKDLGKDLGAPDKPGSDIGKGDTGSVDAKAGDLGACANLAGTYSLKGTCNSTMISMPTHACIYQTGCTITLYTSGTVFTGTVTGSTYSVSGTVMGYTETCTGSLASGAAGTISCQVAAASLSCTGSATKETIAKTNSTCCAPDTQNCTSTDRCTLVAFTPSGSSSSLYTSGCIKDDGTKKEGESCTYSSSAIGLDDCVKGTFCTGSGAASGSYACRKLCTTGTGCSSTQGCISRSYTVPATGICLTTCDPTATTSTCGTGLGCYMVSSLPVTSSGTYALNAACFSAGTKADGAACQYANDCLSGSKCEYDGTSLVCMKTCKKSSPSCPTGKTCKSISGTAVSTLSDVGVCG